MISSCFKTLQKLYITSLFSGRSTLVFRQVKKLGSRHAPVPLSIWRRPLLLHRKLFSSTSADIESSQRLLVASGEIRRTNEYAVQEYFSRFEEVEDVRVKLLPKRQLQRHDYYTSDVNKSLYCICEVRLKEAESAERILKMNHVLKGRRFLVQRTRKHRVVIVNNLPSCLEAGKLKEHFAQFGSIEKIDIPEGSRRGERKHYCYITFSLQDAAIKAVKQKKHEIGSFTVNVSLPHITLKIPDIESSKRSLFVGGMVPEIDEDMIYDHFSNFAKVENVIKRRGQQNQFCFVKLQDAASVDRILKMNHVLGNNPLSVERVKKHRVVLVNHLPSGLSAEQLEVYFAQFGSVEKVEQDRNNCFLTFSSQDEAVKAVEQQDHQIGSFTVTATFPGPDNILRSSAIETSKKSLFVVGNLPGIFEETVHDYFSNFVKVEEILMKKLARYKRLFFVKLKDAESIDHVLKMNHVLGKKPLTVQRVLKHRVVFVYNLPFSLSVKQLAEHFNQFGSVEKVEIPEDFQSKERKDHCYVTFSSQDEAVKVVEQKEHVIDSFIVSVRFTEGNEPSGII